MAYIIPNSKLQVFKGINLDNRYLDTVYFANAGAQDTAFSAKVYKTFDAIAYRRNTSNSVKIEAQAGDLLGVTYMRFKNTRAEDMWFYCFVNSVDYVSETTCIITYEIDVFQTWFIQKGKLNPCMVLREHALTDNYLDNHEPEPIGNDLYQYDLIKDSGKFLHYSVIIQSSGKPVDSDSFKNGIFCGTKYSAIPCDTVFDCDDVIDKLDELLGNWDMGQRQEEVVNLYTFPTELIQASTQAGTVSFNLRPDSYFKGYLPKNKKLMNYPYTFLFCTTMNGDSNMYKWESFTAPSAPFNTIIFNIQASVQGGGEVICYPLDYMGVRDNWDACVKMDNFPKNSFTYDAYQAWVASGGKTKLETAEKFMKLRGATTLMSDVSNIANAHTQLASGGINDIMAVGKTYALKGMSASTVQGISSALGGASAKRNAVTQSEIGLVNDIIDYAEAKMKISYQWKDVAYQPNPVIGEQAPNIAVGDKHLDFYFFNVHIHDSEMKKLDDFLSCYGYATNKVKVPNLTGRKYWNFVQTENCTISGNMPASSKEALGRIFDGGITIWHNLNQIGNYLQSVTNGSIDNPVI